MNKENPDRNAYCHWHFLLPEAGWSSLSGLLPQAVTRPFFPSWVSGNLALALSLSLSPATHIFHFA
jgi:hypothetical protein